MAPLRLPELHDDRVPMANRIVSGPGAASASKMACRSEPGPLSEALVTTGPTAGGRNTTTEVLLFKVDVPVAVMVWFPGVCSVTSVKTCTLLSGAMKV